VTPLVLEEPMMTDGNPLSEPQFEVVINLEEQYSIWPADKPIPAGWRAVGKRDMKSVCLAYIDEAWTDMRPLSLRKSMAAKLN
jgi:MbtH protein